jgi:16S rRNA (adenine1518-N6/adenine1519-N6)-dimethyltransferase
VNARSKQLRKVLGQHFLRRSEACEPLVEFLSPEAGRVVEVGPGSGTLTAALLARGAEVLAWELDPRWAAHVSHRFAGSKLTTVVGDATQLPWPRLPRATLVAGNLPYNVATRIVVQMLEATVDDAGRIERAGFLVQREVADRLAAQPGQSAYGSLSVLVAVLARVEKLGLLPPGAFHPPPKVDSCFVGLTPVASGLGAERWTRFGRLVRGAFAQRRKTLRNSLRSTLGPESTEALMSAAGLDRSCRAESLGVSEFLVLLEHWEGLEP